MHHGTISGSRFLAHIAHVKVRGSFEIFTVIPRFRPKSSLGKFMSYSCIWYRTALYLDIKHGNFVQIFWNLRADSNYKTRSSARILSFS